MRKISRARFDAIAGYARLPEARLDAHELRWFESESGSVLATTIVDQDHEYSGVLFAPDLAGRFRWVSQTPYCDTLEAAVDALEPLATSVEEDLDQQRVQGDESDPVDFFAPVIPPVRQHENFTRLTSGAHNTAAKTVVSFLMRWYENQDGNFVEQFQTSGFDARIWELYLFATLIEAGYAVTQPSPSPDFLARGLDAKFHLEATTINPSLHKGQPVASVRPDPQEDLGPYLDGYLPIRFAGPLTAKLKKQYWKNTAVASAPFVLAIQDFHDEMTMVHSWAALPRYLYGLTVDEVSNNGIVTARYRDVESHQWGRKEIPSGFFRLPGSEYVSAVLSNSTGTIAKFDRIGVGAGFGRDDVMLMQCGRRIYDSHNATLERFATHVTEGHPERWIDGTNIYHNPNAINPLNDELFPGAAHHQLIDGELRSHYPPGHLVSSQTLVIKTAH